MALKILFLSHKFNPDVGGIESISQILAENFFLAGHEVRLITWTKEPDQENFPFPIIRKPGFVTLIKEHAWADIVFENNLCLRLAWPAIFFNRPSIIGLQTWITKNAERTGWNEKIKFRWLRRANQVISCSEAIKKKCSPESVVIGNPYQENIFRVHTNVQKTADFIFLGRLVSDKGADIAIRAFHQFLRSQKLNSRVLTLTIVGDGPEKSRLEQLVNDLNLKGHVEFKGIVRGEKLVECLNQHRYIIVPSVWEEPFGIVALEGMACGCLPFVSDCGGLPDAVGKAGLTFPKGDIDALVGCIESVMENPKFEQQLRNAAKDHLIAHNPRTVARRYLEVIESN